MAGTTSQPTPPPKLESKARLHLVRSLIAEGMSRPQPTSGPCFPERPAPPPMKALALAIDSDLSLAAARRLAVAAPLVSPDSIKDLARRLLSKLGPEDRLQRARAWRREAHPHAPHPSSDRNGGAAQLEIERRRELARAEHRRRFAARSTPRSSRRPKCARSGSRAAGARLSEPGVGPVAEKPLSSAFKDCLTSAERALAAPGDAETRRKALTLRLDAPPKPAPGHRLYELAAARRRRVERPAPRVARPPSRVRTGRRMTTKRTVRSISPGPCPSQARCLDSGRPRGQPRATFTSKASPMSRSPISTLLGRSRTRSCGRPHRSVSPRGTPRGSACVGSKIARCRSRQAGRP